MYIHQLERHIQVLSRAEAQKVIRIDRDFWHIISIHGPAEAKTEFSGARKIHYSCFDDVDETATSPGVVHARAEDLAAILEFARSVNREPLIVQCQLGISRSTAVALALISDELRDAPGLTDLAVDILLQLRPTARPNPLVLKLALGSFLDSARAEKMANDFLGHPRLAANRSGPAERL